jgi:hypothetical protein
MSLFYGAIYNYELRYLFICTVLEAKGETQSIPTDGNVDLVYRPLVEIRGGEFR